MTVSVFALGSCRLIGPIKYLSRMQHVRFANDGRYWYAHNTKEFLQRLHAMQGDLADFAGLGQ